LLSCFKQNGQPH